MKRLLFIALAALAFVSSAVHAQATSTFKVNVTLTPKCYVNMTATPSDGTMTDVSLPYIAFQATDAKASTGFSVNCTNTYPYSVSVGPDTNAVAGITYYLTLAAGSTAAYNNATGHGSLTGQSGAGATPNQYTIGVLAPKSQPGTCTSATGDCVGSNTHTVTVTY